ncbi:MAG: aspartate-semialdehyde dehydrogenase [Planctomycetes bacterium]|nr:aspartate-semialdehyde dehydrogenase [Planctomycetota bacterium]MCP4771845.1 aspartate-semialdehyde dehydrogenase [Planctomycetota bacterium]MCP4861980.1 aspartate-semialdehyde dehydrogenase [Planctomycetota bacterium]
MSPSSSNDRGARLPANPRVAVIGASGLVGHGIMECLQERNFPAQSIEAFSPRDDHPAKAANADLVFLAAPTEVSQLHAPRLVAAGCIVIDLSPAWRLENDVPLVVPEINAKLLETHHGLIASPNCTNVPLVIALAALQKQRVVENVIVTTMQAASGAGRPGLECLAGAPSPFAKPLVGNLIPQCDDFDANGVSAEEQRMVVESQRLLAAPHMRIMASCVRVPVAVGHAMTVYVQLRDSFSVDQARECFATMPGLKLYKRTDYPGVLDCVGNDLVHVGRLRQGNEPNELHLWLACNNLRKGAATNAVQIAEELLPH